ncbi:hypothetical protein Q5P01_010578 [Channa striata]|uniref:Uncharacterized protein n=1 Tax=Channa striata TaxID=64152 RepID=A0AA88MY86_CHASR|nr:hypothetical protein Q5P01_010578 [Channa striata]
MLAGEDSVLPNEFSSDLPAPAATFGSRQSVDALRELTTDTTGTNKDLGRSIHSPQGRMCRVTSQPNVQ